jgi:hypothetical protein
VADVTLKLYEVKVFHKGREVRERDANPFTCSLDLDDATAARDLLNRHLIGAAARASAPRNEWPLFHLEVRDTRNGKGYGQPLFRWVLPAPPEVA